MLQHISTSATRRASAAALTALLLLLSGCDQHDDQIDYGGGPSGETVSGTAAVGLPIVGGSVGAKCQNGSAPRSATTNSGGRYSFVVPTASFPCVLRVSGGTVSGAPNTQNLHSFATGGGTANVTPLTDLALALSANTAAGQSLAQWFDTPSNWSQVSSGLTAALNTLRQGLIDAGYDVPANWTAGSSAPLSSAFTPNPATDPYDALLEAIAEAIENSGAYADYAALLEAFASGGADLPEVEEEEPTDPEDAAGLALVALYAGTYTVNGNTRGTVTVAADGATIDFDTGKNFAIQGGNVYNRIPNFPSEPRVQIELFPAGQPQQRIRIFVDPADASRVMNFVFYPDATSEANAIIATVTTTTEPDPELPAPNGNGSALNGSDGATGTLNGTTYTYTTNTGWSSLTNAFMVFGSPTDSVSRWALQGVPATVGTHNCKSNNESTLPRIQLVVGGSTFYDTAPTGGACRIEVQSVTNDTITGRFSATLVNASGQVVGTVTDGYFRKSVTTTPTDPDPTGPTTDDDGELDGRNGATGTINGTTYTTINSSLFQGNFASGSITAWRISRVPTTVGTYNCSDASSPKIELLLPQNQGYTTLPGADSCTIEVLSASSTHVEARFTATMYNIYAPHALIGTVSNGFFRRLNP
jgi:hypothetical protein